MKLQRCFAQHKAAVREWGELVARRYVQRVQILRACQSIQELRTMQALRFHELKGNLEGYYAIILAGRSRLILSFPDETQHTVLVEEVNQHYGD